MTTKHATDWPKKLKAMRSSRKLTQKQAAAIIDVPVRTWIGWENAYRVPTASSRELLRLVFQIR